MSSWVTSSLLLKRHHFDLSGFSLVTALIRPWQWRFDSFQLPGCLYVRTSPPLVHVQTRWSSHTTVCKVKVTYTLAFRWCKFDACCLLSCRNSSTLKFCLLPTHYDWPCFKVKVTEMSMSLYSMYRSTVMPSLNVIAEIVSEILAVKKLVKFETHLWPWMKVVIELPMVI